MIDSVWFILTWGVVKDKKPFGRFNCGTSDQPEWTQKSVCQENTNS